MGVIGTAFGSPKMITKDDLGWNKIAGSTYGEWKSNDYENAYPSITKINNKFMMIRPFAVDGKGEKIETPTAVINALYHPNILNSSVEFREALSLMYLVHRKTHILVWRKEGGKIVPGGKMTANNIGGFSFMEGVTTITIGGKTTYTVATENGSSTYTDSEVITLRGLDPYHINTGGFSATQAACKWTTIDDYIAQYQKGFFKNGAVPSGEFVISARTTKEFNDIVDRMQDKHRGADNNNNVIYTHRPIDPATGKTEQADIEWIPFAVSNRELSLKDLFDQANKKIDSAYGVPASIRGVGENNNYATARTDQQNFMENVVDPIALKIWTGFTHELNRITGGLGVGISYEIEIPAIADEEKVQEETKEIRDNRAMALLDKGYSLSSVKKYMDSNDLEDLELVEVVETTEDNPDVDEGNEVKDAPDPNDPNPNNKAIMQVSYRDHQEIYEDLDIDFSKLGCIMLDTEKVEVLSVVGDDADADLVSATDRHDHQMGTVGEIEPHVTLLFGLLENGNIWKDKVDNLLEDWSIDTVKIEDVSYFDTPDSYAIIAHIEKTTDLLDGHDRLTLLPHINTFSEYKPHLTLAYIKKDADIGKWITALNEKYSGAELKVLGINYGDLPDESDDSGSTMKLDEAAKRTNPKALVALTRL